MGNPVRNEASFVITMPHPGIITLRIYDCAGRLVDTPIDRIMAGGTHEIRWRTEAGAGIYFFMLESPWQRKVGKLVITK